MLAVSCSKSEPEAPVYEQMLTGEWDYNPGTSIHTALSYAFSSDHTFSYNNSKHQLASGEWQMPNDSILILRKLTREGYEQSTLGVRFLSDQEMYITEGSTSMRFIKSAVNVSIGMKPWNDPEDITLGYDEGMGNNDGVPDNDNEDNQF